MFSESLVALVTPMGEDGRIDYECLGRLIDWHVESGTNALVIAGTTGESATLAKDEHARVITTSVELADGRIPVIAGTGSNSTQQTIELSQEVGRSAISGYLMAKSSHRSMKESAMTWVTVFAVVITSSASILPVTIPRMLALQLYPWIFFR